MIDKSLKNVNTVTKIVNIDLSKYPKSSHFLKLGKTLKTGYSAMDFNDGYIDGCIHKIFSLYGKAVVSDSDTLSLVSDGYYTSLCPFESSLSAFEIESKSEHKAIFISSTQGVIVDFDSFIYETFSLPDNCIDGVFFDDRIFLFSKDKVYFSKRNDYKSFSSGDNLGGSIGFDHKNGDIVALKVLNSCLMIICQNCIYKLNSSQKNFGYQIERLDLEKLNVKNESVVKIKEYIYFINNDRLCYFDGNSITPVESLLDSCKHLQIEQNGELDDGYFIKGRFNDEVESKIYLIKPSIKEESYIKDIHVISSKGGFVERVDIPNSICRVCENDEIKSFYYLSEGDELNDLGKKAVVAIKLKTTAPIRLSIYGDFGVNHFDFAKGYTKKRCNLISDKFTIEISAEQTAFNLSDLSFEYYVKGE